MRSRKDKNHYIVLFPEDRLPVEISREKTDILISDMKAAAMRLQRLLKEAYRDDDLYKIICEIIGKTGLRIREGKCGEIDDLVFSIANAQKTLASDDEDVPTVREAETIQDYGFTEEWHNSGIWERKLEDTDEKEVAEEVIMNDPPIHRTRTTIWNQTNYGRSSKEILYEDLPIDNDLMRVIQNTRREIKGKET